jgi:hypothetical protein
MTIRYFRLSALIAVLAVCAASGLAQKVSDKYLISAKAGGVNEIVGDVTVERAGGRVGRLFKSDEVQVGEKVSTGADGKAEVLMNPGSYIRLGANSSFEFESTDLDDVQIKMHSGSAMLEVFGAEDFDVTLTAGASKFTLLETGIYRVDVAADGNGSVSVIKGKVRTGNASDKAVGKGKRAQFAGSGYAVAKFDRDEKDELELWSKERAKGLSKLSASLKRDTLRDPLISSFWGGRWNLYSTFGLWVYNPFTRSHCFLPFGHGWYSPYGYGFGRPIWNFGLPTAIYRQPPPPSYQGSSRPSNTNRTTDPNTDRKSKTMDSRLQDTRTREYVRQPVTLPRETRTMPSTSDSPSGGDTRRTVRIESKGRP